MSVQLSHNSAQDEAIQHSEGPLLIIAGAGTGKTHVITSRLLQLLNEKKIPAHQLLALTFTEKAAQEMLERVELKLPLSHEEIAIKTFHGFCENLLRERGLEIGIDSAYRLLDTTEQWLFLKKNLFAFELQHYRPLGNPNRFLFVLLNHFSRLKDEDVAPQKYENFARTQLEKAQDEAEREQAEKMLEVARAYTTYQHLLMADNALDFGDLQYYALRLFEERPSVLAEYQERFRYLMVDEFQDTNFAQNKLVMMLAQKYRNLTVVGDDDQAIYKWRGASLNNILNFEKNFPEAKKIVLTQNYRSRQSILDVSYEVIQHNNPERLEVREGIDKKLLSARADSQEMEASSESFSETSETSEPSVQIWHFENYLEEAREIAHTIQTMVDARKAGYGDFAILVRTNGIANVFVESLKEADIPFSIRSSEGLLHFEEIRDLMAVMRLLKNPYDDVAFFRLACLPLFGIPMAQTLDIVEEAKAAGFTPLFKHLRTKLAQKDFQHTLPGLGEDFSGFQNFLKLFEYLLDFSKRQPVSRILGEFLKISGYHEQLLSVENPHTSEKIQRIGQFLEIARSFEQERVEKDTHPLRAFLEYLELLEQAESALEPLPSKESDTVTISTIHSAKGLEFKVVFLPSLVAQRFPSIERREPLEIPLELLSEEIPSSDHHLAEERRLFYVACTRARDLLIMSSSDFYGGRKRWKPSLFLEEAKASRQVLFRDFVATLDSTVAGNTKKKSILEPTAKPPLERHHQPLDPYSADEQLLRFPEIKVNHLSYSQLDTFRNCPFQYKFRYLFHVRGPAHHAANFGSSLHNTLNVFSQKLKEKNTPSITMLQELYEQHWLPSGYESKHHEVARKQEGWRMLETFFEREKAAGFPLPAYLERSFRFHIGKFTFSGRIDRIDRLANGKYEVIDYKTGTSKRDSDLEKDLQLSLYALASKEALRIPVEKLSLYFLDDGMKVSTTRSDEDLAKIKKTFEELSNELLTSKFLPTPGFHCKFCEYRLLCAQAQ